MAKIDKTHTSFLAEMIKALTQVTQETEPLPKEMSTAEWDSSVIRDDFKKILRSYKQ
ncbi:MAG: hypothetical protein WC819_02375 [Parcubacteria group bacterium]|jgi:hypothetical protein